MSRLNYARVTDRLLGGSMPYTERHVELLRAQGVAAVINLCEDGEYWLGERESVERGYRDARLPPDGKMTPEQVTHWTAAIDH